MLHASIDAFKLFEVPGGQEGVVLSISLTMVSMCVPLGVLVLPSCRRRLSSASGLRLRWTAA